MKKNKKRLLIGTLILFVVWSCVTVFIIFKDNKNIDVYVTGSNSKIIKI